MSVETPLTIDDLPAPSTRRWVPARKAVVVQAVKTGVISVDAVLNRYNMTRDEFERWEVLHQEHGVQGLRTTRIQNYR